MIRRSNPDDSLRILEREAKSGGPVAPYFTALHRAGLFESTFPIGPLGGIVTKESAELLRDYLREELHQGYWYFTDAAGEHVLLGVPDSTDFVWTPISAFRRRRQDLVTVRTHNEALAIAESERQRDVRVVPRHLSTVLHDLSTWNTTEIRRTLLRSLGDRRDPDKIPPNLGGYFWVRRATPALERMTDWSLRSRGHAREGCWCDRNQDYAAQFCPECGAVPCRVTWHEDGSYTCDHRHPTEEGHLLTPQVEPDQECACTVGEIERGRCQHPSRFYPVHLLSSAEATARDREQHPRRRGRVFSHRVLLLCPICREEVPAGRMRQHLRARGHAL